jgi:hypothetical protein
MRSENNIMELSMILRLKLSSGMKSDSRGKSSIGFIVIFAVFIVLFSGSASARDGDNFFKEVQLDNTEVYGEIKHDISPHLRNIHPVQPPEGVRRIIHLRKIPRTPAVVLQEDQVLQSIAEPRVPTVSGLNFEGIGQGFVGSNGSTYSVTFAPPDTNGSVGATQYVQWVNTSFAVFDKATGNVTYGPAAGNTLWTGFGGPCQTDNDGDPIALYDKAANRWIMTQFAVSGGPPYYQCIAVSQTSDATGAYYRYAFQFSNFNDYSKIGIWPDAYYMSFNMFQGNTFLGSNVCAMDRSSMLNGLPAAMQCFQLGSSFGGLLPSDLDGNTAPPSGAPNYFLNFGVNSLNLWKFHVDWASPGNTTLTGPANIPVAAFSEACGGGACIPQIGTNQRLDSLGDRLMYRLAYRNFGDHEALVVNHSVTAGSSVGIRWYEIRSPGATPAVYQQGTFAPDSNYRWMGSIGMDKTGNIALGYSVSGSSMFPAIRYTGRASGDPLGTLQAENTILNGSGSQTRTLDRWGDYSAISIDPQNDCTFWYTNEYLQSNGTFNWHTRIASFKFPSCPDFSWTSISGATASSPALAWNPTANKMQLVVTASNNTLWAATFSSGGTFNNDWVGISGVTADSPVITWNASASKLYLLVRASDSTLWSSTFNSAGSFNYDWINIPGMTASSPGESYLPPTGSINITVRAADGSLWTTLY